MKNSRFKSVLLTFNNFVWFFLLVAFVTTCCMMLFVETLAGELGVALTNDNIATAAKLTFLNVLLISLAFTVFDAVRRKITVKRPVRKITEATTRMINGDFDVRIKPSSKLMSDDMFNDVAECINKMAEELSGVETLRADFISNVSHEMKTPLAVIQNYGKLLEAPGISEEERIEYAEAITNASRRLSDMITNILKLTRLENQQIYPKSETYDLSEQLCECLLQYEQVWESKGIEIETELLDGVFVTADRELLSLVWNNLFSNALKFTEAGGRVSLSMFTEGEYAAVRVSDTGVGMSGEVGKHIFEKFYQGDTSRATAGNGLGLALVKRVVDIMHAEISVESALGKGSTFTVKLRRVCDEADR